MSNERKICKPKPVSGFHEWLPEVRLIEQRWMDHIRRVFESYGFCNIETPSVEELDVLRAKGEVDKEIYVIERLHKDDGDKAEARLALHFDQTVPLARYVAQNFNGLVFPFKRYQMQRVWRGERPQLGRSREFYQCDIDVIGVDSLPIHFDAEIPMVVYEALTGLGIGRVQIKISNRKIMMGLLNHLGIEDAVPATRVIDKLDKIGLENVKTQLAAEAGLSPLQIDAVLQLATIKGSVKEIVPKLKSLAAQGETMKAGIEEMIFVMESLKTLPEEAIIGDLSIIRGLDYYTGTVYETSLLDIPEFSSSVCSGGRYDDLASSYISKHLPGVGISIGFTRLFEVLNHYGHVKTGPKCPTDIMVVMASDERRADIAELCRTLRKRGINVEMFHAAKKIPDQLKYASKKGIPYVWFPEADGKTHEVKNMATGEQAAADPSTWKPGQKD